MKVHPNILITKAKIVAKCSQGHILETITLKDYPYSALQEIFDDPNATMECKECDKKKKRND